MAKKIIKEEESFQELEYLVQEEFERQYQESLKKRRASLFSLLGLLAVILTGIAVWVVANRPMEKVANYKPDKQLRTTTETTESENTNAFTRSLVTDKENFSFNWSMADYDKLETGTQVDASGDSLTDIIKAHGKGSSARLSRFGEEYLSLDYASGDFQLYDDQRRLSLQFYKNGDEYYLSSKTIYNLPDEQFPTEEVGSSAFKWIEEKFAQITVGDVNHGKGGATYEEVIALGGLPHEAYINAWGDAMTKNSKELLIFYQKGSASRFTTLDISFKEQEDGTYRVYAKNATFNKNLLED